MKGLGLDLVENERVQWAARRWGERFARRILTAAERAAAGKEGSPPDPLLALAGRFAAKEAVLKALGTGLAAGLSWQEIEILRDRRGRPVVRLSGEAARFARRARIRRILVSITHARSATAAVAVAE